MPYPNQWYALLLNLILIWRMAIPPTNNPITMKSFFRKIHLWLSLPFGIIFSVICLTGAILVFEKEITALVSPETAQVRPTNERAESRTCSNCPERGRACSNCSERRGGRSHPMGQGQQAGHGLQAGQEAREGQVPQSGIEQPRKAKPASLPFFREVRKLHRWLLNPPVQRGEMSVGKVIVGTSTLLMVVVLLSGVIIWIPKGRKALKNRLRVSFSKGWRRFLYDSHVSLGIYVVLFLLLMALTGLTWSFDWYRDMAYGLFSDHMDPSDLHRLFYTLHTGSWGGTLTKTLYFFCALIGALLPWTGYYLWYKKRRKG